MPRILITATLLPRRKHFPPIPWQWALPLGTVRQAQSSRIRRRQPTTGCRSGKTHGSGKPMECRHHPLSTEATGFLATSTRRVTTKGPAIPAPPAGACTGAHWPPRVRTGERALTSSQRAIPPQPRFCETSKIQLVMLSLFFYGLCSWFHTVTNAAWLWISVVKLSAQTRAESKVMQRWPRWTRLDFKWTLVKQFLNTIHLAFLPPERSTILNDQKILNFLFLVMYTTYSIL